MESADFHGRYESFTFNPHVLMSPLGFAWPLRPDFLSFANAKKYKKNPRLLMANLFEVLFFL